MKKIWIVLAVSAVYSLVLNLQATPLAWAKGAWVLVNEQPFEKPNQEGGNTISCKVSVTSGGAKFAKRFKHHQTREVGVHTSTMSWNPPPNVLVPGRKIKTNMKLAIKGTPGKHGGLLYNDSTHMKVDINFWSIKGHQYRGRHALHHTEFSAGISGKQFQGSNSLKTEWEVVSGREGVHMHLSYGGGGTSGSGNYQYIYAFKPDHIVDSGRETVPPLKVRLEVDRKQIEVGQKARVKVLATGGEPPYSYIWLGDAATKGSTREITGKTAGSKNVSVEVKDSKGRSVGISTQVLVVKAKRPPLKVRLNPVTGKVEVARKIRLTAQASGGDPPYKYLWLGRLKTKNNRVDYTPRSSGKKTLTVEVTDSSGKKARDSIELLVGEEKPVCEVRIRPSIRPNPKTGRVEVLIGEIVDLEAIVTGCRGEVEYHWSGEPGATGVDWPEVGWGGKNNREVSFVSRKTGPKKLTVSVTDKDQTVVKDSIVIDVMGVFYQVDCVRAQGNKLTCTASPNPERTRMEGSFKDLGKGPFTIRWEPHPDVTFTPLDEIHGVKAGGKVKADASSDNPRKYRIWVDVLVKTGPIYTTVGESPAVEVSVPQGE